MFALLFDCRCDITHRTRHDLPRLKPTEERFNSSMGKIIVRPDFMSEEVRVKLLQKDSKNHSCRIRGTMEELAPTPFACAIFEAKCRSLIFPDSEKVTSRLVLSEKKCVLSSLKVGLFFAIPPKCINEVFAGVSAHICFSCSFYMLLL